MMLKFITQEVAFVIFKPTNFSHYFIVLKSIKALDGKRKDFRLVVADPNDPDKKMAHPGNIMFKFSID